MAYSKGKQFTIFVLYGPPLGVSAFIIAGLPVALSTQSLDQAVLSWLGQAAALLLFAPFSIMYSYLFGLLPALVGGIASIVTRGLAAQERKSHLALRFLVPMCTSAFAASFIGSSITERAHFSATAAITAAFCSGVVEWRARRPQAVDGE